MKKFVTILLSMLVLVAGSVCAKTTSKSKSKSRTSATSKSRKSNSKPTKASVLDLIKKSEEKVLENGMTIVTYTFHKKYEFYTPYYFDTDADIEASLDWPVNGPEKLVEECRNFITNHLNTSSSGVNAFADYLWNLVQQTQPFLDEDEEDGLHEGYMNIGITATPKITQISFFEGTNYGIGKDFYDDREIFLNSNGKELTYSMFPPISKMRPLLLKYLHDWDEPVTDYDYLNRDVTYLDYPSTLPEITSSTLNFQWEISQVEKLTSNVPIKEILPLASPELGQFLVEDDSVIATIQNSENSNQIYSEVEQPAEFPGGVRALMRWLGENIRYPEDAQLNEVQGKVVVKFVVEKDGSVTHAEISKGVDKDLDNEALRIVRKMPKWQPGKNKGEIVRTYFNLPITFKLQTE